VGAIKTLSGTAPLILEAGLPGGIKIQILEKPPPVGGGGGKPYSIASLSHGMTKNNREGEGWNRKALAADCILNVRPASLLTTDAGLEAGGGEGHKP